MKNLAHSRMLDLVIKIALHLGKPFWSFSRKPNQIFRSSSVQSIRSSSKSKPKQKLKNTDKSNSGYQNRIVEKSTKTSHSAPHVLRRNKSATVVGCEIISNHRPGSKFCGIVVKNSYHNIRTVCKCTSCYNPD